MESTRKDHRKEAEHLVSLILSSEKDTKKVSGPSQLNPSIRIGISGSPGVGKRLVTSCFLTFQVLL